MKYFEYGTSVYFNQHTWKPSHLLVDHADNNCLIVKSNTPKPVYSLVQITLPSREGIDLGTHFTQVWGECTEPLATGTPGGSFRNLIHQFKDIARKLPKAEKFGYERLSKADIVTREIF